MAFDEHGRLFVAEMRGYPNGGVGTGDDHLRPDQAARGQGRRRRLRDEPASSPTGCASPRACMPWKGGLLVANAPDLIYLEDTDGDGKADQRTRALHRLRPGQHPAAAQQPAVGPRQLGLRRAPAANGGTITLARRSRTCRRLDAARPRHPLPARRARQPGADLRRRAVRPDRRRLGPTGSPPPTASTCGTSSCPTTTCAATRTCRVGAVTLDIPEHGAAVQGAPHQPVRGLARRAHHAPQGRRRRQALPDDRAGARRLRHLGVQPARLHRRPVPEGVPRQRLRLRPGQQPDPSRRCWTPNGADLRRPARPTPTASSSPRPTTGSGPVHLTHRARRRHLRRSTSTAR